MPVGLISSLVARSPNRETLDCSVAWTPGPGPGHLLSTQVMGVVRRTLVDTPDHGGRSERVQPGEHATTERVVAARNTRQQNTMPEAHGWPSYPRAKGR